MPRLHPQDPRPTPVSDGTVSGEKNLARQEEEDRRERQGVSIITQDDTSETTEGEGVDFLTELLELVGYPQVNDDETEKDLS